jgi:hypothetical protein
MAIIDYDNNKHRFSDGEQFYCPLAKPAKHARSKDLITTTMGRPSVSQYR